VNAGGSGPTYSPAIPVQVGLGSANFIQTTYDAANLSSLSVGTGSPVEGCVTSLMAGSDGFVADYSLVIATDYDMARLLNTPPQIATVTKTALTCSVPMDSNFTKKPWCSGTGNIYVKQGDLVWLDAQIAGKTGFPFGNSSIQWSIQVDTSATAIAACKPKP